ncbi:MAG: transposase [Candidatus Binatia bacterium]
MMNDHDKQRRSVRLKDYDYRQSGAYFVTIVTQDRRCLFGDVVDGKMRLNDAGHMVFAVWNELSSNYPGVETDHFVAMPNHIHGVIILVGAGPRACPEFRGQPQGVAPTKSRSGNLDAAEPLSLPDVLHRFKTLTTQRYTLGVKQAGWVRFNNRLWQRNYFEHVIRNEDSLNRIRQYILDNPMHWEFDRENPAALKPETDYAWRQ